MIWTSFSASLSFSSRKWWRRRRNSNRLAATSHFSSRGGADQVGEPQHYPPLYLYSYAEHRSAITIPGPADLAANFGAIFFSENSTRRGNYGSRLICYARFNRLWKDLVVSSPSRNEISHFLFQHVNAQNQKQRLLRDVRRKMLLSLRSGGMKSSVR